MTRADLVIVLLALALLPFLYSHYWGGAEAGDRVEIWVNDTLWGTYDLFTNRELRVPGRAGISELAIHDGRARFTASACRDKVCVQSGWLAHGGEVAACLPNGVSLRIAAHDPTFDSLNF